MGYNYASIYEAMPMSREKITAIAYQIREDSSSVKADGYFDIVSLYEFELCKFVEGSSFQIMDTKELDSLAETDPYNKVIYIREDIYIQACRGDYAARYTLAHEFGHLYLHNPNSLIIHNNYQVPRKILRNPEWQADVLAAELLAPSSYLRGLCIEEISSTFGISFSAAKVQSKYIN